MCTQQCIVYLWLFVLKLTPRLGQYSSQTLAAPMERRPSPQYEISKQPVGLWWQGYRAKREHFGLSTYGSNRLVLCLANLLGIQQSCKSGIDYLLAIVKRYHIVDAIRAIIMPQYKIQAFMSLIPLGNHGSDCLGKRVPSYNIIVADHTGI